MLQSIVQKPRLAKEDCLNWVRIFWTCNHCFFYVMNAGNIFEKMLCSSLTISITFLPNERIESGALHDQSYFSERKNRMHCHVGQIYLKASIKYKLLNVFENI